MSAELTALYPALIVEHSKAPRNFRALGAGARRAEGHNALCGDRVAVYVAVTGDLLEDVAFQGVACAIATASASVMTETVKGRSAGEALRMVGAFRTLVTEGAPPSATAPRGALDAFAGVSRFPSRVKCALLAWQTLEAALGERKG